MDVVKECAQLGVRVLFQNTNSYRISEILKRQLCSHFVEKHAQLVVCISFRVTTSYRFSELLKRQLRSHFVRH